MKPVDAKTSIYIDFNKENNEEGSKFKVDDKMLEYQNIKMFLEKAMFQIDLKRFL